MPNTPQAHADPEAEKLAKPARRSFASVAVRAVLGLLLLGTLLWLVGPASLVEQLGNVSVGYIALAFAAQAATKVFWAMRWQEILRVGGIDKSLPDLIGLVLVGMFFNNFLPSAMGGDIVRGYYSSGGKGTAAAAYGAVLVERLTGFAALAALCALSLLVAELVGIDQLSPPLVVSTLLVCAGIMAGCALMFLWTGWSDLLLRVFRDRPKAVSVITGLGNALQFMRRPGCRIWRVVALSLLVQIAAILFFLWTARAVGIGLSSVSFFIVVPLAVIASMVPISLNGLGLREGAFVGLLQAFGVAATVAGAFAVLARLIDFVVAACGGLVFVFRRLGQQATSPSSGSA